MKTKLSFLLALLYSAPTLGQQSIKTGPNKPEPSQYQAREVRNTLTKKAKDIQSCWLDYLKTKNPKQKGKVQIDWMVSEKGIPRKVELIANDFGNSTFESCLILKIKGYEFPPPPDGKEQYIDHTFAFATEEELEKSRNQPLEFKAMEAPKK